jgi:hypothetical protein
MIFAIYPNGITQNVIVRGQYYGTKIKVYPHKCYFESYKIDDRYYWFYDEEKIYHVEDSKTGKVVLICINDCPSKVIDEFLKMKEVLK